MFVLVCSLDMSQSVSVETRWPEDHGFAFQAKAMVKTVLLKQQQNQAGKTTISVYNFSLV